MAAIAACDLSPTAPSPLAGEGSSVFPRAMMGEGFASQKLLAKKPPHPSGFVAPPLRPPPQGARARAARALLAATSPGASGRRQRRSRDRYRAVDVDALAPDRASAQDAAPLSPTAPSPLAGEGSSVLPRAMMGEGFASQKLLTKKTPHPSGFVAAPLRPLPQGARARAAQALLAATSPDRPRAFTSRCQTANHLTMSNSQSFAAH